MDKSTNTAYKVSNLLLTIEQIYSESKIIIVGCLASWTLRRLGFGFVWLILLLYVCRTYYDLTTRCTQRAIRDETRRHYAQKILAAGETVNWLNELLDKIWHLYERPLCQQILQHVNASLPAATAGASGASQRVVLHSMASIEHPLHFTRVNITHRPDSHTMILEGEFTLQVRQRHTHGLHAARKPLINLRVYHTGLQNRPGHDLDIQIREFEGGGILRLEIDCSMSEPTVLLPQIELRGQPKMDCTVRSLSHYNFSFDFAHHVDWREVVEKRIREVLGRVFKSPVPLSLPFARLFGEGALVEIMRLLWQVHS